MLKDVGVSKEFFEYEFDKAHGIGAADGDKQNVIVRFRFHQFASELYYSRKKIKNKKIGLKPSLTKKEQHFYVISREKSKLMRIIVTLSNSVILTSTAILK